MWIWAVASRSSPFGLRRRYQTWNSWKHSHACVFLVKARFWCFPGPCAPGSDGSVSVGGSVNAASNGPWFRFEPTLGKLLGRATWCWDVLLLVCTIRFRDSTALLIAKDVDVSINNCFFLQWLTYSTWARSCAGYWRRSLSCPWTCWKVIWISVVLPPPDARTPCKFCVFPFDSVECEYRSVVVETSWRTKRSWFWLASHSKRGNGVEAMDCGWRTCRARGIWLSFCIMTIKRAFIKTPPRSPFPFSKTCCVLGIVTVSSHVCCDFSSFNRKTKWQARRSSKDWLMSIILHGWDHQKE